jgi:hypothetical protein
MHTCNRLVTTLLAATVLGWLPPPPADTQEVVQRQGGPPPEVRALVDAVMKALNDGPDAWEALAKERFTPALFKKQTAAERKAQHQKVRSDLGTVKFERATRMGPDAPLFAYDVLVSLTPRLMRLRICAWPPAAFFAAVV